MLYKSNVRNGTIRHLHDFIKERGRLFSLFQLLEFMKQFDASLLFKFGLLLSDHNRFAHSSIEGGSKPSFCDNFVEGEGGDYDAMLDTLHLPVTQKSMKRFLDAFKAKTQSGDTLPPEEDSG